MPGNRNIGEKKCMSHFPIWFVSENQPPESMSSHNELSSTVRSILLPCGCLLSHPLNVEYILSYSEGLSLSLSRQLVDNCPHPHPSRFPLLSLPLSPSKKPVTPPPPPPCAGLEIEMMEGMGGFDWLRCWDVILRRLKCEVCVNVCV